MKKIFLSVLCLALVVSFIFPVGINAKTNKLKQGWTVSIHSPNSAKKYHHAHITNKQKGIKYCIRLDNFKPCDKKSNSHKKKVSKWVMNDVMKIAAAKKVIKKINTNKLKKWKNKIPKKYWYSAAGVASIVATFTIFFPGDDRVALGLWKIALS